MKGILLKFLSTETWMDKSTKDTQVTYEIIDSGYPGELIWGRMTDDLKDIYLDDSNYGIQLESSKIDCPIPNAESWGGYSYQWSDEHMTGWVNTTVWYIFIEAEPA